MTSKKLKFQNSRGFVKVWGTPQPSTLEEIFSYLNMNGYSGPVSWRDPAALNFVKQIDLNFFLFLLSLVFFK
ncbi:hypothetical protein QN372_15725, partial [Undibacterium sp. RTI2.1]|uniref:hypothetical protein n=1 Tax=Undibacterium sp. RTI2.1 TaxID=3048637 RepID=UPI002B227E17